MDSGRGQRESTRLARAWRLCRLLEPDQERARRLFVACIGGPGRKRALPPRRLDRLILLRARERAGSRSRAGRSPAQEEADRDSDESPPALLRTLHTLPRQAMEAWLLRRLDALDEVQASRAMDCSKSAMARHLAVAYRRLEEILGGNIEDRVSALRAWSDALEPAGAIRHLRVARRRRRAGRLIAALLVAGAIVWLVVSVLSSQPVQRFIHSPPVP